MKLWHGSQKIIETPQLGLGKIHNDYGQGFYCTESLDLAREWACSRDADGFVNRYELDIADLKVLDLLSPQYCVLHWIAFEPMIQSSGATSSSLLKPKLLIHCV